MSRKKLSDTTTSEIFEAVARGELSPERGALFLTALDDKKRLREQWAKNLGYAIGLGLVALGMWLMGAI